MLFADLKKTPCGAHFNFVATKIDNCHDNIIVALDEDFSSCGYATCVARMLSGLAVKNNQAFLSSNTFAANTL
jgi:hypothetical protein